MQQQQQQQQQESRNQTSDDSFHSINDQGDRTIIGNNTAATPPPKISVGALASVSLTAAPSPSKTAVKIPSDNFGETYLSMEEASESQYSEEDSRDTPRRVPNKHPKKRTKETAFTATQEENREAKRPAREGHTHGPLSTSSPVKETKQSSIAQENQMVETPISPLSQVQTLDRTGAIPKEKTLCRRAPKIGKEKERRTDGQHLSADNCGCHSCIFKLAIIKNEIIRPDRKFSKRFLDQVKKLKIHHHTSLTSHPQDCICKMHVEKINTGNKTKVTPPKPQQPHLRREPSPVAENKVSNLRSHFEEKEVKRIDPRTGHPPLLSTSKPNSGENKEEESSLQHSSTIPVLTSR